MFVVHNLVQFQLTAVFSLFGQFADRAKASRGGIRWGVRSIKGCHFKK